MSNNTATFGDKRLSYVFGGVILTVVLLYGFGTSPQTTVENKTSTSTNIVAQPVEQSENSFKYQQPSKVDGVSAVKSDSAPEQQNVPQSKQLHDIANYPNTIEDDPLWTQNSLSTTQQTTPKSKQIRRSKNNMHIGLPQPPPKQKGAPHESLIPKGNITDCMQCRHWTERMNATKQHPIAHTEFVRRLYVETVKMAVTGYVVRTAAASFSVVGQKPLPFQDAVRFGGMDWPGFGFAMTGMKRLNQLEYALDTVISENVPGDFIECGVWRGGTSILARAIILSYNSNKTVYVADSFRGLPKSSLTIEDDHFSMIKWLSVPVEEVRANFDRFHVLDERQVKFLVGFFSKTMPQARKDIKQLCVLRLDGDMYESCFDVIVNLYDRLSVGGFLIVDDWQGFLCQTAIKDFRKAANVTEAIHTIDYVSVFWRKTKDVSYDVKELYDTFYVPKLKANKKRTFNTTTTAAPDRDNLKKNET